MDRPTARVASTLGAARRRLVQAREVFRSEGIRAVVSNALPVLGYHRITFFETSLNPPSIPPPLDIPLTFDFLGREEVDALAALRPELPRATLEDRLDQGHRCFVARFGSAVVGAYWVHRQGVPLPELGRTLVVPEDAVYVCDAFVAPEMRGRRVALTLSRELKNRLAAEGFERWIFYVLGGNEAGLKNAHRGGARETSRAATLKLGPLAPIRMPYLRRLPRSSRMAEPVRVATTAARARAHRN